jgi:hypothetical protein
MKKSHINLIYTSMKNIRLKIYFVPSILLCAGETAHSPAWAGSPGSKLEVGRGFITFPSGSIKNISLNTSSFIPIL